MRILITGGTGLIGTALTRSLLVDGNQVWNLTRSLQNPRQVEGVRSIHWDGHTSTGWGQLVSQVDAIVNLAGESIGSGSWTPARKDRILSSRVQAGKAISDAIQQAHLRPKVVIQASAVGYYGPHGTDPVTEETAPGSGFLAEVCRAWEASTQPVERLGARRVVIRTGIVLSKDEGALQRMMLPFKYFAGGPLGSGKQGLPWIHPADEVAGIRFLLENDKAQGLFNFSAPEPLSNAEFGRILARIIKRPYWLPAPAFAMRLLLGEMSTLVLEGQFMFPRRLQELGFHFKFGKAEPALRDLLAGS